MRERKILGVFLINFYKPGQNNKHVSWKLRYRLLKTLIELHKLMREKNVHRPSEKVYQVILQNYYIINYSVTRKLRYKNNLLRNRWNKLLTATWNLVYILFQTRLSIISDTQTLETQIETCHSIRRVLVRAHVFSPQIYVSTTRYSTYLLLLWESKMTNKSRTK